MSSAARYLVEHNRTGKAKKLPDGRLQIIRKWDVPEVEYARATEVEKYLFQEWGTPDGVLTGIDATKFVQTPDPKDIYPNTLLVDQYFEEKKDGQESDATTVLVKVYETLAPSGLTPAGKAQTKTGPNGLLVHTEYFITRLDYDVSQFEEVGAKRDADIRSTEVYLSGIDDLDNHYAKVVEKVWSEAGILNVRTPKVGGQQTVQVAAIGMTEAAVVAAITEVTANHKLIDASLGSYEGLQSMNYTFEVDAFEVLSTSEDGMKVIDRTQLATSAFARGVVGTDTHATLFLTREQIDNGNTIKKRVSRYSEAGLLSIRPVRQNGFSLAPSYIYVTTGAPASSLSGLIKPDGTQLGTSVTWLEPEVQNIGGFPTYTQQVIAIALGTGTVKVHSGNKFFTVTEPGVMSTGGAYNTAAESGGAVRYPQATKQPQTYRKKATVEVYLTNVSTISETEVAFTEKGVDWCSIAFDSFYTNEKNAAASVSANWRSFPKYLNSGGTTNTAYASSAGKYFAEARSHGAGDTSYVTSGIYRVDPQPYQRAANGTQLYLKTVVTF